MALDEVFGKPWTRKHDNPSVASIPSAPRIVFPHNLEDVIEICATRKPNERLHAAGSHWALSTAAVADQTFIETHDPRNAHAAMGKTLYDVIPNCMNDKFIEFLANRKVKPFDTSTVSENEGLYPIHIETGKTVFQLYAELDGGDTDSRSLANLIKDKFGNSDYLGPWAFRTLGGAGGQTVFGALHTGTHGGDIKMPPIADAVMALHLVVDGGKHFWIEPNALVFGPELLLTDTKKLEAFYGQEKFWGPKKDKNNFSVIRNSDLFNSVLMSAGRFGVVYSIVIAAVRQYTLHQERRLTTWQAVRPMVSNPASALYTTMADGSTNKFLQIAISVTPHANFTLNHAGVTKRRNVAMAVIPGSNVPAGRPERVGAVLNPQDPLIQGPRFEFAGNSHTYAQDPANPGRAKPASFLENACSDANFVIGVIKEVMKEVEEFVASNGVTIGAILGTVAAAGGGGLLLLLAALLAILALLALLLSALEADSSPRLGQVMNDLRETLLGDPATREAGLVVWQMIASEIFTGQQDDFDYAAISYAVMDGHDYLDQSCNVNVQSIEVFFDATDPMLPAYIDALLAFETGQEKTLGRAFVGYVSMRFMGRTRALLGQQQFPVTCAVEVAGLADVSGTTELVDHAITLALDPAFNGILHWGQRNDATAAQIRARFGDPAAAPLSAMGRWQTALKAMTNNGQLDGFSNAFTRQTGLEAV
jgi:hypothetical protein